MTMEDDASAPPAPQPPKKAAEATATGAAPAAKQRHNPLHGVTLEHIVTCLADYYGWENLAQRIPVRCFQSDPSIKSSLAFLRKTPWAREKVEGLYLYTLREDRRMRGL
ncbi:MAG: hypothetical protein RJB60_2403 [Pseudomonadota bacterium]|jgi:uncharacterized protein (DUF2132 family)